MNDTTRIVDPAAISRAFSSQLGFISSNPPTTSALIYLLPPCLVLIAIDVATRLAQRPKPIPEEAAPSVREVEMQHVITRVHEVLIKFQTLERKLSTEQARSKHLVRMLQKQKNFALHRERLIAYNANTQLDESPKAGPEIGAPRSDNDPAKNPFEAFCQRLLLQNRIWAQQREIKALQSNLGVMKKRTSANAFQAFCDRLLLSNNIWKQQKEIDRLMGEAEKLKRSRVVAVTRAAKQMVLDVRKERLTEEFVKDLIMEVEECRKTVITLRSEHEREVQELAEEWRQECRKLRKEVEKLELARDAHLVEQGISNDMESRLLERLAIAEEQADVLDEQSIQLREDSIMGDDTMSCSDFDHMSNMSTSTCVGSGADRSPTRKTSFDDIQTEKSGARNRRSSLPSLKTPSRRQSMTFIAVSPTNAKSPNRKLDPGPYAGFSFNPLFFRTGNVPQDEYEVEAESSPKRVRTYSLKSTHSLEHRKSGSSLSMRSTLSTTSQIQPPKRAQWRL